MSGPQFVRYFGPVLDALRELGGSGRPGEVASLVADRLGLSDEQLAELLDSGQPRFKNQVQWARFYLAKAGYIDSSRRGVWTLSDKGRSAELAHGEALSLFREIHGRFQRSPADSGAREELEDEQDAPSEDAEAIDHRSVVLQILRELPPSGFERLCQRLLRESGFREVHVTGRSGDGGIDGHGILEVNPLVTFRVMFQCKRHQTPVGPATVREFQGAVSGRADKGILLTTTTFTTQASREAVRDGAPPIELVDQEKLIDMLESLELGLSPLTTYEVDRDFFSQFSDA